MSIVIGGIVLIFAASLSWLWWEVRQAPLLDADEQPAQPWTDADFDTLTGWHENVVDALAAAAETAALEGQERLYEAYADYVRACLMTHTPAPQYDEFISIDQWCMRAEADQYADAPGEMDAEIDMLLGGAA